MKRFLIITSLLLATATIASASMFNIFDNDTPIKYSELPDKAQTFIKKHYAKSDISHIIKDVEFAKTEYKVVFTNGVKLEFDSNGEWTEIDCRYTNVPTAAVPNEIADYIKTHYPSSKIIEINRDSREWEVKITGGLEITFNNAFDVVEIDD